MSQNNEFLKSLEMGKDALEQVKFWQSKIDESILQLKKIVAEDSPSNLKIIEQLEAAAKAKDINKIIEIKNLYANKK
jgi:hypothetical protein